MLFLNLVFAILLINTLGFESLADESNLCNALKNLRVLDINQKVKNCISSKDASYGKVIPSHGAVMVVSHREMLIGCYGFERFLLPDTETIFVFDEDFVNIWKLDELVRKATRKQTLGVHLVITSALAGDVISKRIALEFIDKFSPTEFMFALNCDVHEMPTNYVGYKSFSEMLNEMSKVFRNEKSLRKNKKTNVENPNLLGARAYHPILAINAVPSGRPCCKINAWI
jgi:hypothetical protein